MLLLCLPFRCPCLGRKAACATSVTIVPHGQLPHDNLLNPPSTLQKRVLIYEAMRDFLPTMEGVVDTPMGPADVTFVDPTRPIKVSVYACVLNHRPVFGGFW